MLPGGALYGGYEAVNMENAWQFAKLYAQHADEQGRPTARYWKWARSENGACLRALGVADRSIRGAHCAGADSSAEVPLVKLSAQMTAVLLNAAFDRDLLHGCRGRSEYGGRLQSIAALKRQGLLTQNGNITVEGAKVARRILREEQT